jgi:hypothetical protein
MAEMGHDHLTTVLHRILVDAAEDLFAITTHMNQACMLQYR